MKNILHFIINLLRSIYKLLKTRIGFVISFFVIVVVCLIWLFRGCSSEVQTEGRIEITPVQISKIQSIGQWEFLAISDEELIDTIRHGFFGDDELARIYYGTLRLGIDLNETEEGWIKMDKDTVVAKLPPIKLLDEHFIDEALTKAFYEKGKWSEEEKATLTLRASETMKARCLTLANIRSAEQNASLQFNNLLRSMGFKFSRIRFADTSTHK